MKQTAQESSIQTARGMHDILPEQANRYAEIEEEARDVLGKWGYREIRTPVMESASLFQRAIGESTDIVEKEMFTLKDRGDRVLCLRPEGTAGVVRAFIENSLDQKFVVQKFFYIGPMFRAERPQKGRYREFYQIGSEWFGEPDPKADVEIINFVRVLLEKFNVPIRILLNSIGCNTCRREYIRKLLNYLKSKSDRLCDHCKERMNKNPLRVLDCKEDSPKLTDAPTTIDNLCEDCRMHFNQVQGSLKGFQIPFDIFPRLVRGLDYYTRTVFEVYPSGQIGSQDALAAGGRYDGLVEQLGGKPTPAVGFALGVERVLNYIEQTRPQREAARAGVFFAPLGSQAHKKCVELVHDLRDAVVRRVPIVSGSYLQSLKSLMRRADHGGYEFCVIIGDNELNNNKATVKNLKNQSQETVPLDQLVETMKERTNHD
jgi:histidyl-tRNA synthetase